MKSTNYSELSAIVRNALSVSFSKLISANPERSFYTFAIWTDDSLQFAHAAANSEEGLSATVRRYRKEVDPEYGVTSTRNGMRWSYGDWGFFPIEDVEGFAQINSVLQDNFDAEMDVFEQQIEQLWHALLEGFRQLDDEGFFGAGEARSRITLLVVGDISDVILNHCATVLNPQEVAQRYIDWDCDKPDEDSW